MIDNPLASIDAWVRFFDASDLPILRHTKAALQELIARGSDVSAHDLGTVARHDALLSLQILRYLQAHRSQAQLTDVTTVERAILMVGVTPMLERFSACPTIEEHLDGHPHGLNAVCRVMQRSYLAGLCAARWANYRHDIDGNEVMTAALLRDIGEILLACFAPKLALRVRALQMSDHGIRSAVAQRVVFGFPALDLQLALIQNWHLPPILKMLMDESHADNPRVRTVATAVAFARHVVNGWDDAALPDDYTAIAEITSLSHDAAIKTAVDATKVASESWHWYSDHQNLPPPPAPVDESLT